MIKIIYEDTDRSRITVEEDEHTGDLRHLVDGFRIILSMAGYSSSAIIRAFEDAQSEKLL